MRSPPRYKNRECRVTKGSMDPIIFHEDCTNDLSNAVPWTKVFIVQPPWDLGQAAVNESSEMDEWTSSSCTSTAKGHPLKPSCLGEGQSQGGRQLEKSPCCSSQMCYRWAIVLEMNEKGRGKFHWWQRPHIGTHRWLNARTLYSKYPQWFWDVNFSGFII